MIVANDIHCDKNHVSNYIYDNFLPYLKDTKIEHASKSVYSSFEMILNLHLILFFVFPLHLINRIQQRLSLIRLFTCFITIFIMWFLRYSMFHGKQKPDNVSSELWFSWRFISCVFSISFCCPLLHEIQSFSHVL